MVLRLRKQEATAAPTEAEGLYLSACFHFLTGKERKTTSNREESAWAFHSVQTSSALLRGDLTEVLRGLQQGIDSDAHRAFVARLQQAISGDEG